MFNPRMLTVARESRRMTQKALAEASGLRQASVSRAEAGVHTPSDATIDAFAKALRYRPSFFAQPNDAPPLPRTFWRKQAKLGKLDQKQIEAAIAVRCAHVQALARSVEVPDPDVPGLTIGVDVKDAADAARYMRTHWRVAPGPILDLVSLLEAAAIFVVRLTGTLGFQGVSIHDSGRKYLPPITFVSAEDPTDRERWTLAHELGHLVLHHHIKVGSDLPDEDEAEHQADAFAGEFLMPAHEIRHQFTWRTSLDDLAQLKLHWRASMASLLRRGKHLERIAENHATRLWKQMSKYGYRTKEPNPLSAEVPALLRDLVHIHVDDLGYSIDELGHLLSITDEEVYSMYGEALPAPPPPPTSDGTSLPGPRLRLV